LRLGTTACAWIAPDPVDRIVDERHPVVVRIVGLVGELDGRSIDECRPASIAMVRRLKRRFGRRGMLDSATARPTGVRGVNSAGPGPSVIEVERQSRGRPDDQTLALEAVFTPYAAFWTGDTSDLG